MKKIKFILTWGLLLAVTHVMGYTITVDPIDIVAGQSTNLVINLSNTETNLTAYQMSLYLPAGVTVQKKANGKYAFTANADRHDGNFTISVKDAADGSILITCFSADKDVLAGSSGELIRLPLDVASTVSSSLQGSLKNIEFTDVNANAYKIADVNFTMAMEGGGSAGGSDEVNVSVADVAITPGGSANLIINMETSLSNLTAYQMSLYLPAGITVQKKSNGKYAFTANADRHDGNFTISVKDAADGSILITCFSADKDVLTGSSGELIRLPLDVASTVSSSLQGSLNNIEFTDVNAQAYHPAEVTITFNYGTNTPVLATGISLNQSSFTLTEVGQTETLSATVTPSNATNKSVTWSSSNTAVATVSSAGVVTAVANGTAIITATTADGTNLSATCAVTVSITGDEPSEIEVTDISLLDNAVYIVPFTGRAGEEVQLVVNLKNEEQVSAYIFDMELPEGVTVATNSNGKYIDALSDRHDDHSRTINYKGNNVYALSALSTNSEVLTGNDGPIRFLTLLVADDMEEGVYAINIRNASFSRPNGSLVEMENTTSTITIEDYLLGDVNGNNGIDIADAVCIVNYLVGKPNQIFIEKAADTNKNGKTDIGDAVTIVNYLVGKTESLAPQLILEEDATNQRDPD